MPKGVLEVDSKEAFDKAVGTDSVNVVLFGTPWCGACKELRSPFLKLSREMKPAKSFRFHKVNVDDLTEVADKWNIESMPTVIIFRNGAPIDKPLVGPKAEEIRLACERALSRPPASTPPAPRPRTD
jgi:thioredoxin 1